MAFKLGAHERSQLLTAGNLACGVQRPDIAERLLRIAGFADPSVGVRLLRRSDERGNPARTDAQRFGDIKSALSTTMALASDISGKDPKNGVQLERELSGIVSEFRSELNQTRGRLLSTPMARL